MKSSTSLVLVTVPNGGLALRLSSMLLQKRLVACANIVSGLSSSYWWKGKIETSEEVLMILKTRPALFSQLKEAIVSVHPYEVPEIISLPIERGHDPYLRWIAAETGPQKKKK